MLGIHPGEANRYPPTPTARARRGRWPAGIDQNIARMMSLARLEQHLQITCAGAAHLSTLARRHVAFQHHAIAGGEQRFQGGDDPVGRQDHAVGQLAHLGEAALLLAAPARPLRRGGNCCCHGYSTRFRCRGVTVGFRGRGVQSSPAVDRYAQVNDYFGDRLRRTPYRPAALRSPLGGQGPRSVDPSAATSPVPAGILRATARRPAAAPRCRARGRRPDTRGS